jgi:hypothetical protein
MARAETPLEDKPNTGATAAGALPSTSSCHRTSRQRGKPAEGPGDQARLVARFYLGFRGAA